MKYLYFSSRGPAQRVVDQNGRVSYQPWRGVTGGKWRRGARCTGAEVKRL